MQVEEGEEVQEGEEEALRVRRLSGIVCGGRFSLCVGNAKAAVLGENRAVRVRGGSFSDHFAGGNAIHIYRIDGRSACVSARQGTVTPIGLPGGASGGGEPLTSHTTFWIITAAMAVLLVGLGIIARLPRRVGLRSGKRAKRVTGSGPGDRSPNRT